MASLLDIAGQVASPIMGAIGTTAAGRQQRKYLNAAMDRLKTGYGDATTGQKSIFDPAQTGWKGLGERYDAGGFDPGQATAYDPGEFKFDFQADPGYQFRMNEALGQVKGSAAQAGMAHSPQTTAALMDRAGEVASQEYGNVYGRQRGAFEADRGFGAQEQGAAYDRNAANLTRQFSMGQSLYQDPMMQSGQNIMNLQTGLAENLANIEAQKGGISGQIAAAPWAATQGGFDAMGRGFKPPEPGGFDAWLKQKLGIS